MVSVAVLFWPFMIQSAIRFMGFNWLNSIPALQAMESAILLSLSLSLCLSFLLPFFLTLSLSLSLSLSFSLSLCPSPSPSNVPSLTTSLRSFSLTLILLLTLFLLRLHLPLPCSLPRHNSSRWLLSLFTHSSVIFLLWQAQRHLVNRPWGVLSDRETEVMLQ